MKKKLELENLKGEKDRLIAEISILKDEKQFLKDSILKEIRESLALSDSKEKNMYQ